MNSDKQYLHLTSGFDVFNTTPFLLLDYQISVSLAGSVKVGFSTEGFAGTMTGYTATIW